MGKASVGGKEHDTTSLAEAPTSPNPSPAFSWGPRGLPLRTGDPRLGENVLCPWPPSRDQNAPHQLLPCRIPEPPPLPLSWSCYLNSSGFWGEENGHPGGHHGVIDSGVRQAGVLFMLLLEKESSRSEWPHQRRGLGCMKLFLGLSLLS